MNSKFLIIPLLFLSSCFISDQESPADCGLLDFEGKASVNIPGFDHYEFNSNNSGLYHYRIQNPELGFGLSDCGAGDPLESDFTFSIRKIGANKFKFVSSRKDKIISFEFDESEIEITNQGFSAELNKTAKYYLSFYDEREVPVQILINIKRP